MTARNYNWMIIQAMLLHATAVVALASSPTAAWATSTAAIYNVAGDNRILAIVLYLGAMIGALGALRDTGPRRVRLLLLQWLVVLVEAGGSAMAVWNGHYADGVIRPRPFIFADQRVYLVFAAVYLTGTVSFYLNRTGGRL